jgi:hypothetical protein
VPERFIGLCGPSRFFCQRLDFETCRAFSLPEPEKSATILNMSPRPASIAPNAPELIRMLRRLRRAKRLDEVAELLALAVGTSARLVDTHCAPDSPAPAYAQAACLRVHIAALSELSARIAPVPRGDDAWERIARELEATSIANDGWGPVEEAVAEDSASWPEGSGAPSARGLQE